MLLFSTRLWHYDFMIIVLKVPLCVCVCACVSITLCLIYCIQLRPQSCFPSSQTCSSEKKRKPNFFLTTVFPSDGSISCTNSFLERECVLGRGLKGWKKQLTVSVRQETIKEQHSELWRHQKSQIPVWENKKILRWHQTANTTFSTNWGFAHRFSCSLNQT